MRTAILLSFCFVLFVSATTLTNTVPTPVAITPLQSDDFYLKVHELGYHLIFFTIDMQQESKQAEQVLNRFSLNPPTLDAPLFLHKVSCNEEGIMNEQRIVKCPSVILIRSKRERREDGIIIIDRKHYHYTPSVDSEGVRTFLYESLVHFLYEDYKSLEPFLPASVEEGLEQRRIEKALKEETEKLDPNYYVRENSKIVKLNELNFDSVLKDRKTDIMIEFFSPSCEPCQRIARDWEDFADKVSTEGKPLVVASVNCKASPALCNRMAIQHYPTVYFIHDTKIYDFGGQWNAEGWFAYSLGEGYLQEEEEYIKDVQTFTDPDTYKKAYRVKTDEEELELPENFISQVEVLTGDNFKSLVVDNSNDVWFLEFYAPWCGYCKKLTPVWESLALRPDRTFRVGKIDATEPQNKDVSAAFGVRGYPSLKLVRDGKVYDYSGGRTIKDFLKFAADGYSSADSRSLKDIFSSNPSKEEL